MNQKLLLFYIIFVILNTPFNGRSQTKVAYLDLKVSALLNDVPAENYSISVYENGHLKDSVFTKKSKATKITLESSKVYSIVFTKENTPKKMVIVNTYFPRGIKELDQDPFKLEVELSPESSKVKQEYDDYPVAILIVSKQKKVLMASEEYFQLTHFKGKGK